MKILQLSFTIMLIAKRCNSQGLGSGLLSLLTEGFTRRNPAPTPTSVTLPVTVQEEISKRDIERTVAVKQRDEPESSLLGTLNLSYAGNMDLSEALTMASRVGSSLAQAIGSLVDLKFVRNVVDIAVDRLNEVDGREGRADDGKEGLERIKDGITEAVGAALGEQECWQRTACRLGEYTAAVPGKDIFFILADRLVPSTWQNSLGIVKESATFEKNCNLFECTADPEETEVDA